LVAACRCSAPVSAILSVDLAIRVRDRGGPGLGRCHLRGYGAGARSRRAVAVHATLGAVILLLTLTRLAWRIAKPPPPYPLELARWERIAGTWTHRLFCVLLIALPLTGVIAASGGATASGCATTPAARRAGVSAYARHFRSDGRAGRWRARGTGFCHAGAARAARRCGTQASDQPSRAAGRMPPFTVARERAAPWR
jgi:cytochrome b561